MNEFEKGVRKAPGEGGEGPGGQTLRSMIAESFRGRQRWMAIISWVYVLVFTALGIYSLVLFLKLAPDAPVKTMLLCIAIFLMMMIAAATTKLWYWMLLNRNSVLREIRRLERRIDELARGATDE
jgi:hypothetical protein